MALHYLRNSRQILEELLEKASIQGYLTCEDLVDASPQVDNDSERQSDLLQALLQRGVEVLESERELETPAEYPHLEMDAWAEPALTDTSMQDSVGMYFKDMSCVPLLSIPEEVELALRIETGRAAAAELAICPGRGRKQEKQRLEVLMQDGIQAREHLIKANTRLVVSIAKRHMGRGVAFLDLIQEGNMGLMKAVEKYDVHRGFRFSTYATWWIRQTISRAIYDQARTIRLPVHMNDRIRHIYKASRSLEQRLGRVPTHEELASEVGISVEKLRWIMMVSWSPVSLESPVGDDEESELGQFIEDQVSPTPAQCAGQSMLKEKVEEMLGTLSPREARVLRMRYGLDNSTPSTLEEVGARFGLTRERIRQIEGKALRRLRHPSRARQLKDYL